MSARRRHAARALHPLAVAAAIAATVCGTAWAQQPTEPPAASADTIAPPKALDSVTVSGARESASSRLALTPRETPQSVNTVQRDQIER